MKFLAKVYHIFLFAAVVLILAPEARCAYPMVRNFTRSEYNAGPQNWCISQAPNGSMLFGNSYGMLCFDGERWKLLPVDNHSTVRSILVSDGSDDGQCVYVGASNEFGRFVSAPGTGYSIYESLIPTIKTKAGELGEVWNIYGYGDKVWFCCDYAVYCYDGDITTGVITNKKICASQLIGENIYLAFPDGTLSIVSVSDPLTILPLMTESGRLHDQICAILPYGQGKQLLATRFSGLYLLDGNEAHKYPTPYDEFFKASELFCASRHNDIFVFGTVNGGVAIVSLSDANATFLNVDTGLGNNTVLDAKFDRSGNLWLGLDNGLDCVQLNSPIYNLLGDNSRIGAGYASLIADDTIYLGSNQGLYALPYPLPQFPFGSKLKPVVNGQVWSIEVIGDDIFVCNDMGLYVKSRGKSGFTRIEGVPGSVSVTQVDDNGGVAMVSTYDNFYAIERDAAGQWALKGHIGGYSGVSGEPIRADGDHYWMADWLKGVYRLHYNRSKMTFDRVDLFENISRDVKISRIGDDVIFSSSEGNFVLDSRTDSLVVYQGMYSDRITGHNGFGFTVTDWGQTWMVSTKGVGMQQAGDTVADMLSYAPVSKFLIPGYENINFHSPQAIIVAGQDGFYTINPSYSRDNDHPCNVYIESVSVDRDSLIYENLFFPLSGENREIKVEYGTNALTFAFAVPEYSQEGAALYSCKLENYDREWSNYSTSASKDYTHLPHGKYIFKVRAIDTYSGNESEASITVIVKTPWYLTSLAKICYMMIGMFVLVAIVWYIRRRVVRAMREQNLRAEEEISQMKKEADRELLQKNYQIERLKSEQLQQDVKHKSNELTSATMNNMRKNEILLEISAKLAKVSEEIENNPDSKKASRQIEAIRRMIRDNISHDDDWKNFTHNFDSAYNNFLTRLLEKYPDLSIADQKVCVYIRMGLRSKEIAPLLNISYRSVEMSRYRLRKKLNLEAEDSLSAYLLSF